MNEFTLLVRERGARPLKERSVLYEELQLDRIVRRTTYDPPTLMATLLFALIAVAVGVASSGRSFSWEGVLFWSVAALGMGVFCWMRSGTYHLVPVIGQQVLAIHTGLPSDKEVDAFLEGLRAHAKTYAIAKFGPIPGAGRTEEQVNRLRWLRDRNYLTDEEFQSRLADLGSVTKPENGPIGFRG